MSKNRKKAAKRLQDLKNLPPPDTNHSSGCISSDKAAFAPRQAFLCTSELQYFTETQKSVLRSENSKFEILSGNYKYCVPGAKEEKPSSMSSGFSSNGSISDGMWSISTNGIGSLNVLDGGMEPLRDI